MLFAFGLKNVVRLPARAYVTAPADDANANSSIKDRWRPGKDNTGKTIPALSSGDGYIATADGNFYATDWYNSSDETVVPLKFQAQNLFVLADKRLQGYDPETINYTTTSYGSLPLARTFTLGLNINF